MTIWSAEIKELEKIYDSIKGQLQNVRKEIEPLFGTQDANVIMLYSRRCLEVIVTDLCETELKRPRKTDPLKGIIDRLNSEEKVPGHIITSMHSLNSLATYGTHPKDFDPEQVKPVLNNLAIILKWYVKYYESRVDETHTVFKKEKVHSVVDAGKRKTTGMFNYRSLLYIISILVILIACGIIVMLVINKQPEKSIAVLPFRNDSPDEENNYFFNGIMEEVLNNLQSIEDLRVLSRTSTERYRDQVKSLPEIAKELGVNYIVEGSGQRYANTYRLRVQLIMPARKEAHLWGKSYEKEITEEAKDIFSIQVQIAEAIAGELNAAVTPEEKENLDKIPTNNMEAYDAFLMGKYYRSKMTRQDLDIAMQYFEKAIEADSDYALAYAGIAQVWGGRRQMSIILPADANPRIEEALMTAMKLDSTNAYIYKALAGFITWGRFDWKKGEAAYRKSIEMNPKDADAHATFSHLLNITGKTDEAMKHIKLALEMDPFNGQIKTMYAGLLLYNRRYDEAIKAFREAIELSPRQGGANNIIHALLFEGREDEAIEMLRYYYNSQEYLNIINEGYKAGGFKEAVKRLSDFRAEKAKTQYIGAYALAAHYSMADDKENTIYWLEKAYEQHDSNIPYLKSPYFDLIRDDPRYRELCRKLQLQ